MWLGVAVNVGNGVLVENGVIVGESVAVGSEVALIGSSVASDVTVGRSAAPSVGTALGRS